MTAPMTKVHFSYCEIDVDVTRDMGQRSGGKEDLDSLKSDVKKLKKMLVDEFYEHCDFGLFKLSYDILDHMAKYIQRLRTPFVFGSSTYEHFSVHMKQACEKTLQ